MEIKDDANSTRKLKKTKKAKGVDGNRCDICLRLFDRPSRLQAHYKTHTGERPFICTYCDKRFSSKGNCNTHMRVHTREKPYQCPHCERKFSQHGQLVIHKRTHTGEKPYICIRCNKGFTCSKVLKIHIRTHTGEKPFECEFCKKSFAAYANLVVHRRIHTKERPYVCKLCGRSFEHSGNLSRHVKGHQVENGIRCIPCGQVFQEESEVMVHTLSEHPTEIEKVDETDDELLSQTNKEGTISIESTIDDTSSESNLLVPASMSIELSEKTFSPTELSTIDANAIELTALSTTQPSLTSKNGSVYPSYNLVDEVRNESNSPDLNECPEAFNLSTYSDTRINQSNLHTRNLRCNALSNNVDPKIRTLNNEKLLLNSRDSSNLSSNVNRLNVEGPNLVQNTEYYMELPVEAMLNDKIHSNPLDLSSSSEPLNLFNVSRSVPSSLDQQVSSRSNLTNLFKNNSTKNNIYQNKSINKNYNFKVKNSVAVERNNNSPPGLIPIQSEIFEKTNSHESQEEIVIEDEDDKDDCSLQITRGVGVEKKNTEVTARDSKMNASAMDRRDTKDFQRNTCQSNFNEEKKYSTMTKMQYDKKRIIQKCLDMPQQISVPYNERIVDKSLNTRITQSDSSTFSSNTRLLCEIDTIKRTEMNRRLQSTSHQDDPKIDSSRLPFPIENLRDKIKRSVMAMVPAVSQARDEFKHKVEKALLYLIGRETMVQIGFPNKNVEQVLIAILDGAGVEPCADVRVDEALRLKFNLRKLLEYCFPEQSDWDSFNWTDQPIEYIVDTIASWYEKRIAGTSESSRNTISGNLLSRPSTDNENTVQRMLDDHNQDLVSPCHENVSLQSGQSSDQSRLIDQSRTEGIISKYPRKLPSLFTHGVRNYTAKN